MSRTPLVAANWKMNSPPSGWDAPDSPYRPQPGVDVIVFPELQDVTVCKNAGLHTGAQYGRPEPSGAFTGDVSMAQLKELGATRVLCGHSERRQHHGETDAFIAAQVQAALGVGLIPILCIGETAAEREAGKAQEVVKNQLSVLLTTDHSLLTPLVLAYEPVWAIGTGKTATPEDAQEMHVYIRKLLPDTLKDIRIIYGGSVKPTTAPDLIAQPDVDGFLVGGASLIPDDFRTIVEAVTRSS